MFDCESVIKLLVKEIKRDKSYFFSSSRLGQRCVIGERNLKLNESFRKSSIKNLSKAHKLSLSLSLSLSLRGSTSLVNQLRLSCQGGDISHY